MNKTIYYLSMFVLLFTLVFLVFVMYFILVPTEIIRPNVQPYKVITKTVNAGGTLVYEVDAIKYREVQSIIVRRFVSDYDLVYTLSPEINNVAKGNYKSRVLVLVPPALPPGGYHLQIDIKYDINPLRSQSYHFATEEFKVATQEGMVKNK